MSTELLTLKQASTASNIPAATLRKAATESRLNAQRIGRDWFVTPAALREYVADYRPRPNARTESTD